MRVAVLGMGRMGSAMAARLASGGHDVCVWNRSPGKAGEALEAGAHEARSVAEAVGGAEVTITSLSDDDAVRQIALGEGGVISHIGAGLYAEASTISPGLGEELAGRFERFVAMPVLGRPDVVRDGSATYLAGGPEREQRFLEPLFATLTGEVLRLPEARLANAAKLASNLLLLDGVLALCEAVTAARAAGLDDEQLRMLFGSSPAVAPGVRYRFEPILTGQGPNWWSVDLGRKDARLAIEMAARSGTRLPVTAASEGRLDEASRHDLGAEDLAAVMSLYRS